MLGVNEILTGIDFGYAPVSGAIGNSVWSDADNDGARDSGEIGIAGVTLDLLADNDDDGNYTDVVSSTATDNSGQYLFTGLASGFYKVMVTDTGSVLTGFALTVGPQSMTDPTDEIFLSANRIFLNADFGYYRAVNGEIGDTVWMDDNRDGTHDAGEAGIGGVVVNIVKDSDGDGVWDTDEPILATTTTDTNGLYVFSGLSLDDGDGDADYLVWLSDAGDVLRNLLWSPGPNPGAGDNSQYNPYPVAISGAAAVNLTADFGYMLDQQSGLVGDFVWYDLNSNGVQDAMEAGIPGVSVDCWSLGNQNQRLAYIGTLETDHNGYYFFPNLDAKYEYQITVSSNNFLPGGVLEDMTSSNQPDNQDETGVKLNRFANNTDLTLDFGYYFTGSVYTVGDMVWSDADGDGYRDAGETGISNVTIACYADVNGNGVGDDGEPLVQTDTTDANGNYLFASLLPADYIVKITDINGALTGYALTDGIDDTNDESQISPYALTVTSNNIQYMDFGFAQPTNQLFVDVAVVKSVDDVSPTQEQVIVWTMVITNSGPDKATGVQFTDNLPADVTFSSYTASSGTYDSVSGIWDVGDMLAGASETLTISSVVNTNTKGANITNEIVLTAVDQEDTDPANDRDDAIITPTLVVLARFGAVNVNGNIALEWETVSETDTVGFYLVRRTRNGRVKVNSNLLPVVPGSPDGSVYRVVDPEAVPNKRYRYVLQEVETSGHINRYGPFFIQVGGSNAGGPSTRACGTVPGRPTSPAPWNCRTASGFRHENMTARARGGQRFRSHAERLAKPMRGRRMNTVKIVVDRTGPVIISATQLAELAGVRAGHIRRLLNRRRVALSSQRRTIPYVVADKGAALLFYGEKYESVYTDRNVYWLTAGRGETMASVAGSAPAIGPVTVFTDHAHAETERYPVTALIREPEADYWLWDWFLGGNPSYGRKTFGIIAPGAAATGEAMLSVHMQGASDAGAEGEHGIKVSLNGAFVGQDAWSGKNAFEVTAPLDQSILVDGANTVDIEAMLGAGVPYSVTYLDSFDLAYRRRAEALDGRIVVTPDDTGPVTVTGVTPEDVRVWDVTDPKRPVRITGVTVSADAAAAFSANAE
ncbi:SdrD B-like domain-containing protein, partial [Verrucomicrobiota bacterium]